MSDDEPDEVRSHDHKIVDDACAALMHHFDSVQIFVTRQEPAEVGTLGFSKGLGNWYARFGQVNEWLKNGGAMHLHEEND